MLRRAVAVELPLRGAARKLFEIGRCQIMRMKQTRFQCEASDVRLRLAIEQTGLHGEDHLNLCGCQRGAVHSPPIEMWNDGILRRGRIARNIVWPANIALGDFEPWR